MLVDARKRTAHDAGVTINAVLRELFAHKTQKQIAAELSNSGLSVDQPTVSAWRRARQPNLDQIAAIERWAGKPLGWILARAGYVAMPDVEPINQPIDDLPASLQAQVAVAVTRESRKLAELIAELGAEVAQLRARLDRRPPEEGEAQS